MTFEEMEFGEAYWKPPMGQRNCEICGQVVDQSVAGKTVNSNGRYWHGKCYETQEKLDHATACWECCVERLKSILQHQQYKP